MDVPSRARTVPKLTDDRAGRLSIAAALPVQPFSACALSD